MFLFFRELRHLLDLKVLHPMVHQGPLGNRVSITHKGRKILMLFNVQLIQWKRRECRKIRDTPNCWPFVPEVMETTQSSIKHKCNNSGKFFLSNKNVNKFLQKILDQMSIFIIYTYLYYIKCHSSS